MSVGHIEISLEESSISIRYFPAPGTEEPSSIAIPLVDLFDAGADGAANRIGDYLLTALRAWQPQEFEKVDQAGRTDTSEPSPFGIAMKLIHYSVQLTTSIHVASIDFILKQEAKSSDQANHFLLNTWPTIRARLEGFETC